MLRKVPAIACDIDGVLIRGQGKSIPCAINSLNMIRKPLGTIFPNSFPNEKKQLPFVCLSNSGGCLEKNKADYLNKTLQLKDKLSQLNLQNMILNFTPLRPIIESYKDKTILIIGEGQIADIVRDCGVQNFLYTKEYKFLDKIAKTQKFNQFNDEERKLAENLCKRFHDASFLNNQEKVNYLKGVSAIFVLNDPIDWEQHISLILSLKEKNKEIPIYCSHNDALYQDSFPISRFGIGAFNRTLLDLFHLSKDNLNLVYSGKPLPLTFECAKKKLLSISPFPISNFFMIGDNPKVDILGGKRSGYKTILVKTGVYKGGNDEGADWVVENFEEAIDNIIKVENLV